jgi:putative tryptophan/tyrosine transport system substrate-binding protein
VAWPVVARAQQGDRVRRIGVLMGFDESDAEAKGWLSVFKQELMQLGWTEDRNVRTDDAGPPAILTGCERWRRNWLICNLT